MLKSIDTNTNIIVAKGNSIVASGHFIIGIWKSIINQVESTIIITKESSYYIVKHVSIRHVET